MFVYHSRLIRGKKSASCSLQPHFDTVSNMTTHTATRNGIIEYIGEHYSVDPEYLWKKYPDYAVFRHADNRKWFAIVMTVTAQQLHIAPDSIAGESVDIIDVKCDPDVNAALQGQPGFLPGYHMNHKNWITIMLDGRVPDEQIFELIDTSYDLTRR